MGLDKILKQCEYIRDRLGGMFFNIDDLYDLEITINNIIYELKELERKTPCEDKTQ